MANLALNGGHPVRSTPFPVWPVWGDEELENLAAVVRSGKWGCTAGSFTQEFEKKFAAYHAAAHGVCVNSGTTALRIALLAADIGPGDKVLVPAYTFFASASAVVEAGAVPMFVDIDPGTYTIDPRLAEEACTSGTAAVMPVHFAGRPADMDALTVFARKRGLKIIEDAAQAWGSEWRGARVGTFGEAGCFSFQSSKNINAGEGGIILTNDEAVARMARSYSNCGRKPGGQWYEHFYLGGNSRMTEFQSAVLLAQLARYEGQRTTRERNLQYLNERLAGVQGIQILESDPRVTAHSAHLFIFRYLSEGFAGKPKAAFVRALQAEGIPASAGYADPLYNQPVFLNTAFGPRGTSVPWPVDYRSFHCPATEKACREEAIWLTQNMLLGVRSDMDDIVEAIEKVRRYAGEME
jgi:dTDP-4-amino-4,6-dideoxygalactose transaminase